MFVRDASREKKKEKKRERERERLVSKFMCKRPFRLQAIVCGRMRARADGENLQVKALVRRLQVGSRLMGRWLRYFSLFSLFIRDFFVSFTFVSSSESSSGRSTADVPFFL